MAEGDQGSWSRARGGGRPALRASGSALNIGLWPLATWELPVL